MSQNTVACYFCGTETTEVINFTISLDQQIQVSQNTSNFLAGTELV